MLWLSVWYNFIHFLEKNQGACPVKHFTGLDCPGCGLQRAFIELLKGNIYESISIHPGLIPLILLVFLGISQLIFKWKNGGKALISSTIVVVLIFLINFTLKSI
ncbi:MAG: hypothetical protein CVU11_09645 [Bacteroidetes bacterium HGW-Bacteroidetes-6]|jgi:hypothetical protein|nr:MAG: hypothetical protein CVU11_09645 [Bacteroidetes bacterium HGW-Bacteroidetes-6]